MQQISGVSMRYNPSAESGQYLYRGWRKDISEILQGCKERGNEKTQFWSSRSPMDKIASFYENIPLDVKSSSDQCYEGIGFLCQNAERARQAFEVFVKDPIKENYEVMEGFLNILMYAHQVQQLHIDILKEMSQRRVNKPIPDLRIANDDYRKRG